VEAVPIQKRLGADLLAEKSISDRRKRLADALSNMIVDWQPESVTSLRLLLHDAYCRIAAATGDSPLRSTSPASPASKTNTTIMRIVDFCIPWSQADPVVGNNAAGDRLAAMRYGFVQVSVIGNGSTLSIILGSPGGQKAWVWRVEMDDGDSPLDLVGRLLRQRAILFRGFKHASYMQSRTACYVCGRVTYNERGICPWCFCRSKHDEKNH
jgi:hypothetical protein